MWIHMKTRTRTGGAVPIMNQYDMCQLVQKWFLVCWEQWEGKSRVNSQDQVNSSVIILHELLLPKFYRAIGEVKWLA